VFAPGFVAVRRYEAETGSPRFFTSYDVESVEVPSSADYHARLAAPSPLTREVMANFRNMTRTVCIPAASTYITSWGFGTRRGLAADSLSIAKAHTANHGFQKLLRGP
jgi:hypothetical protein